MQTTKWLSYNELAWTEPIIAPPGDYADESRYYARVIRAHAGVEVRTLLHLGCGAGIIDHTFKSEFDVTGVDISAGMLAVARTINPEVAYVHGDMRTIDLQKRFDAVAIPDAIDYMQTLADLQAAVAAAGKHLAPGGALLIVAKTREQFRENNFCYTGNRGDIEITIFENNYIPKTDPSTYEATMIYLIRESGRLRTHTDRHRLGLFSLRQWRAVFEDTGLTVREENLDGVYDRFIMGDGQYPMTVFAGVKPA